MEPILTGLGFFFTTFLLEVAKLSPALSGFVFLAGQIVDALTAPAIGKLTDNTSTRWGRRRVSTCCFLPSIWHLALARIGCLTSLNCIHLFVAHVAVKGWPTGHVCVLHFSLCHF